ncbi:MAG: right-handed parallel beta-helix repeat-containing protein [Clostridia bacterium]|nr:right-handed parallel beta-helix repeat-containing protein [Clostridia bacterium]
MSMECTPHAVVYERVQAGLSVVDFGARGDGRTDDTAAFLQGVAAAAEQGLPLQIPAGEFRLTQTLELPGITLCGIPGAQSPALLIDHVDGPGLRPISGAVTDLCLRYPGDHTGTQPAILLSAAGCRVSRVHIANAYDGILFADEGPSNPGRSNVHEVTMVGIRHCGMRVTNTYDVACLRHIIINGDATFREEGVGFLFGKNDDVRVSDCTVNGAAVGFSFTDLPAGDDQGETFSTWGSFSACRAVDTGCGIHIRSHFPSLRMAPLLFHHCDFDARLHALDVRPCGINISLYDCRLTARQGAALHVLGAHDLLCNHCRIGSEEGDGVWLSGGRHLLFHNNHICAAGESIHVEAPPLGLLVAENTEETFPKEVRS